MLRPTLFLCLLLFGIASNANGQQPILDSLQNELENKPPDSSRADLLITLARMNIRSDFESAMSYTMEAFRLCDQLPYDAAKALALRTRADLYSVSGLYDQATNDAIASLELYRELGDEAGEAGATATIGTVHYYLGETEAALKSYNEALEINLRLNNTQAILSNRNNIGSALARAHRYKEALPIYKSNLDSLENSGRNRLLGVTLNNIGAIYQSMGEHAEAMPYFRRAEKLYAGSLDSLGLAGVYGNLAEAYLAKGQFAEARTYIARLEKSARASGSPRRIMSIYELKTSYHDRRGESGKALKAYRRYVTLKDSISQEGQQERVAKLRTAFETEKKLEKITAQRDKASLLLEKEKADSDRKEAEISNQTTLRNAFITGFALVLVFFCLIGSKQSEAFQSQ